MRFQKCTIVVFAALALALPAPAQFIPGGFGPLPPYGFGASFGHGHYHGGHLTMAGYIRGGYPGFYGPFGYPYGWSSTTIIISPPAITVRGSSPSVELPTIPEVPPLAERGDVIAIKPQPGGVKNLPPIRAVPEPAVKKPAAPPPPLIAPPPAADKTTEAERQIKLGKDSFAAGEPGEALDHFRQATVADPQNAQAFFLLGQAQFALARYREATATIVAGLKLKPDWPSANFHPRELYGARAADHADDLDQLRVAVEQNPNEPSLQFLYGYQLWFVGRRKEARALFEAAAKLVTDPAPIRRFLDTPD
jgi:tetratricopeptide repeat protein